MEHQKCRQRQRHYGHLAAERADGLGAPQAQKVALPPESAGRSYQPARGPDSSPTTERCTLCHSATLPKDSSTGKWISVCNEVIIFCLKTEICLQEQLGEAPASLLEPEFAVEGM